MSCRQCSCSDCQAERLLKAQRPQASPFARYGTLGPMGLTSVQREIMAHELRVAETYLKAAETQLEAAKFAPGA
jgi:hypothetical protein